MREVTDMKLHFMKLPVGTLFVDSKGFVYRIVDSRFYEQVTDYPQQIPARNGVVYVLDHQPRVCRIGKI